MRSGFIQRFHSLVARQLNRYYKESDSVFSGQQTNFVQGESGHDRLRRIVYTLGNSVADGIEREGKNHKGIRSSPAFLDRRAICASV